MSSAKVMEEIKVTDILTKDGTVTGVITNQGTINAEIVVNCGGQWA